MFKQLALAAVASLCGAAGLVSAAPVTVPNFSFEAPSLAPGQLSAALALMSPDEIRTNEYWFGAGNGGNNIQNIIGTTNFFTLTGSGTLPPPGDGTNFLLMGMNGNLGYVWQDIGPVQSNTVYTLTIAYGQLLPNANGAIVGSGLIALVNGSDPFENYLGSTNVDSSILTAGTFADATAVVTTGNHVSGDLTILMLGSAGNQIGWDNVRLDATPAPNAPTPLLPTISPTNQVFQGQAVTLSENSAGQAPFTYQWLSDNGSGGATFTPISGATSTNYVANTSSLTPGSTVEYEVSVQNGSGTATSAPITITILTPQAPFLTADTTPHDGNGNGSSEPLGGSITFAASFSGSVPIGYQWQYQDTGGDPAVAIAGATNSTLTLTNLQLTDTGFYYLVATNLLGSAQSTEQLFNVSQPTQTNDLIISIANQFGPGGLTVFTPSWLIASNSLIAGLAPSSFDTNGSFAIAGAGGTPVLTDGKFGVIWPAGTASASLASCGQDSSGAGSYLIYTLPAGTTNGINVTNIVVYGGWSDSGRDEQSYNIYYSTTANPTNYDVYVGNVTYDPTTTVTPQDQSATRISITGTNAGGVIAYNVAGIKFDFSTPVENGWCGYAEIQIFGAPGTAALAPPLLTQPSFPSYAADVVGGQETFTAGFSGGQISYQWLADTGSGPLPVPGATNNVLTLSNLQIAEAGLYSLQASNSAGVVVTPSASTLVVNPTPTPDGNGVDVADSIQVGVATLPPTWTVAPGSLIAGKLPTTTDGGFEAENTDGGIKVLTDGQIGSQGNGALTNFEAAGPAQGKTLIYTLSGSAGGYNLTNIVVYGGWQDGGRDEQAYTIYYSTVAAPTNFLLLDAIDYLPSGVPGGPNDTRVSLATGTPTPLATNVFAVEFDFTTPAGENGWEGYAEIQLFGSAAAAIPIPVPALTADTAPPLGSEVVGSTVTFTAAFNSTLPITYQWQDNGTNIPGATGTTLTLSNLQLADSGSYNLVATTASGSASSTPNTFVVVPAPSPVNGIVESPAIQASIGFGFIPTWPISSSSLIAGKSPTSVGIGNFATYGAGGTAALTDGTLGEIGAGIQMFAAAGNNGDNSGESVTYTLTGSATGYDLTNITVFGGWQDSGRDQQAYTVSYSTVAAPATFSPLASVSYLPTVPGTGANFTTANATRVIVTTASGLPLATDVAQVKFDFTTPAGENGWEGYAELEVFGTPSVSTGGSITINTVQASGGNLILTGIGGASGGAYEILTATNLTTPLADWTTNTSGVFGNGGAFSNGIPVLNTAPARFFRIKTP